MKRSTTRLSYAAAAIACAAIHGIASAQPVAFTIDSAESSVTSAVDVVADVAGTFIGNHDPETNPGGTMTWTGFFPTGSNDPIPYTGALVGDGVSTTQPSGSFDADLDQDDLTVVISGLFIDALSGARPSYDATLLVTFSSFNTTNPTSTYPGVSNFPVPLGSLVVTVLTLTQFDQALPGTLTPVGGGGYEFSAAVPVEVHFEGHFDGDPLELDPFFTILQIDGQITIDGTSATAVLEIEIEVDDVDRGPFPPFEDIPLDLPTVLPPGETAHLLVSGEVQSVAYAVTADGQILAHGEVEVPAIPGDLNGDGVVNVDDLLILLANWGPCPGGQPCPDLGDINEDGEVNVDDLLILLANWTA